MDNIIGIDIGGTSIVGGRIAGTDIVKQYTTDTKASEGGDITLNLLKDVIRQLINDHTQAIGIGVPSVVDREKGIVYNVQNINNWDKVHLKEILETEFNLPIYLDNDANCFALGEKIFGKGANFEHFVGITLGTGVGGGIIQNNHLLKDANCGSGEFGELPYKDSIIEEYAGSRFFQAYGNMTGYEAYQLAQKGDATAINIFNEYGKHVSALIKMIMLTLDPQAIILGGSIAQSYELFKISMYENLKTFTYQKSVETLDILVSDLQNIGVLGAGALCVDNSKLITTMILDQENSYNNVIGVIFGGRFLHVARIENGSIAEYIDKEINNRETEEFILNEIISTIQELIDDSVVGIGVGVPSLVDVKEGIVYKPTNVPSWRKVYLKNILEERFNIPAHVNNDANCFALGEKYFGLAKNHDDIAGITLGTGMGVGIIINGNLYSGKNAGAGEFCSIPYRDHDYEYYLSTKYFEEKYGLKNDVLFNRALKKDKIALAIYELFGTDLGNAIKTIMYAVDPEAIVLGGRIIEAYDFFQKSMFKSINSFLYPNSINRIKIYKSEDKNISIYGAAALCFENGKMHKA